MDQEELRKKGFFSDLYKEKNIQDDDRILPPLQKYKDKVIMVDTSSKEIEPEKNKLETKPTIPYKKLLDEFRQIKQSEYIKFLEMKVKQLQEQIKSQDQFQKEWLEKADLIRENQELKKKLGDENHD